MTSQYCARLQEGVNFKRGESKLTLLPKKTWLTFPGVEMKRVYSLSVR